VEENAATAKTLEQQARAMDERVSYFRLAHEQTATSAAARPAGQMPRRASAGSSKSGRNGYTGGAEALPQAS
jgi:hypothetical protein